MNAATLSSIIVFFTSICHYLSHKTTFAALTEIGVLLPWDGRSDAYPFMGIRLVGAVDVALEKLNFILPEEYPLGVIYRDTRCDNIRGSGASVDLWQNNVTSLIGPPCSSPCRTVAYFAAYANIPMVSWFCADSVFMESESLPFFSRVFPPFSTIAKNSVSIMKYFDWRIASLIAPQDTMWEILASEIYDSLEDAQLYPVQPELYDQPLDEELALKILERVKEYSRIIWLTVGGMTSLETDELIFMKAAYKLGMTSGEFVFLRIELFPDPGFREPWTKDNITDLSQTELKEAYNSMLLLTHRLPWNDIKPFLKEVARASLKAEVPFFTPHKNLSITEPSIMSTFLHDAVLMYGLAYNTSLSRRNDTTKANISYDQFRDPEFIYEGMTGPLLLDDNGDRISDFTLYENAGSSGAFYEVGIISGLNHTFRLFPNVSIDWPGETVPSDAPSCGFNYELCLDIRITIAIIIGGVFVLVLVCAILFASIRYRRFMSRTDWIIDWDALTLIRNEESSLGVQNYPSTYRLPNLSANFSRNSLIATSIDDVTQKTNDAMPNFALANLNSLIVVIRKGPIETLTLNKETKRELKEMRWLVQDNINRFFGICVLPAPDNCFYHTSEFCSKGTLKSILAKDDINLDLSFKMSFIQDLARGMQYIHNSEIKSHGLLCSTLCFIDSRWVLKISGFGTLSFQMFKENAMKKSDPEARFSKMAWTSPELLRQELPVKGSVKGDVYSFGIMVHEIMTRTVPYHNFQTSAKVIIRRVMKREEPPFRPDTGQEESIEKGSILADMVDLKRLCWEELPEHRPDFHGIRQKLRNMQKGQKSLNIMDNMLSKMEKYTENLEKVVANRTEQLLEEKKKTDALLYRMLPQMVADELKKGSTFPGEFYDEVTIYFSDIVRFTDLSAESSPMQVVDLLNDLYTCFDAIIEKSDVYKVETIGDAYMVVSGLPNRNGQRHASEIASMSLDIRNAVKDFKVRHRPDHQLQIRIGINSGPVCAGVVGLTMPRFCLFGDTVNTASRMESNSLAQKIHVSSSAAKLLTLLGGYCLEYRGELPVKGKGIMHTFWLLGREEDCTDHGHHNMFAGKKLSTDTLLSNDSLLSPSGNGAGQAANSQSEPTGTANKQQEANKSVRVDLPEGGGESSTNLPESNGSDYVRDFPHGEGVNNPEQTVTELPGTVLENAESIKSATTTANSDTSSNELTSSQVNPSTVKNNHLTDAKVDPRRDAQKVSNHMNVADDVDQSSSLDEDRVKNNRNKKLNQLLGEKAFQSFEEMHTAEELKRRTTNNVAKVQKSGNRKPKTNHLDAKHVHMNGSCHSIKSLENISSSSYDNFSYDGSESLIQEMTSQKPSSKRSNESIQNNGDLKMSTTPRINIDPVS